MYREFIATEWKPNTFTTIAFNGGYVGIVVGQSTGMSIWNAPSGVPNIILETGENVKTKTYDHEGCGTQFSLPYKVKEGVRYGYMLRIEHIQKNSEFPNGVTDYSSWFIDQLYDSYVIDNQFNLNGINKSYILVLINYSVSL
jgi:hypothetical protein